MTYDPRFSWNEEDNPGELQGEQRTPRKQTGRGGGAGRRIVPALLAIGGLVLFAGIVWYAYSWGRSDGASEAIPVVQAPEGAEKERPENPGGMEVPYQDTLVLNPGNSENEDESVERLLPPPEEPVERSEESDVAATAADATGETEAPEETAGSETSQDAQESQETPVQEDQTDPADSEAQDTAQPEEQPAEMEDSATSQTAEISGETDVPEPAGDDPEAAAQGDPGTQDTADSSQTVADAFRIQLAAVRSNEAAQAEWQRLQNKHEELLGPLSLNIERADLGEQGVYYRIQAGPLSDEAAADTLCSDLQARDQACLVRSPQ
ncbi:SPOR domain-containing protein [Fodinicurvata halophila]|uniref:SPOR domain-containing protein n=1 Tax=Fodinicurvata halophila TaxID=1419723 RepID=A0ABV8UJ43_9PROT